MILNGTTSAGKTTLAVELQAQLAAAGECWLVWGIDDFLAKLPVAWLADDDEGEHADEGIRFDRVDGDITFRAGPIGDRLLASYRGTVAATVERHGAIHCLVNNAGITRDKLLIQMKEEDWDAVLDTNLKGAYTAIQAATKPMMKQRFGRIINIASVVGQMGNAGQANYAAAKAGLIGLTKSVGRELASRNVTANAVTPGYIETDMTANLPADVKAEFTKQIPLGRMGSPGDIAAAVAFLASDEAGYMTGQVLSVNGGMLMP